MEDQEQDLGTSQDVHLQPPGELTSGVVEPPQRARITVVDCAYHQPVDAPPTILLGDSARFSRELQSDEQPYERRLLATEDWRPLDCGWIDKVGMLLLRNDEGFFPVRPTPEQRAEVASRVVELTFSSALVTPGSCGERILVPPGESCRFYPKDAKSLRVRCTSGKARYTLCLSPE